MFIRNILFTLLFLTISSSILASVHFRDKNQTFNRLYHFLLEDNEILYKFKDKKDVDWKPLPLHKDLTSIKSIASDDEYVIAIDDQNQIFTMFNGLSKNPKEFKWIKRWGAPFGFGPGMKLPANNGWDISFFSPAEDEFYQAFNGNKYKVGQGVTNIFYIDEDQQTIIYLDPWLPRDSSYQVCSPLRGRFKAANISSSGSTIFLIGENGDMYVRLFDFDVAGCDGVFFSYTYKPDEYTVPDNRSVLKRKIPRPLPLPGWNKQPAINGIITDRITIFKIGTGGLHRTLRVEGIDHDGNTGYFTKDIKEDKWRFVVTNEELQGRILQNGSDDISLVLGEDKSIHFYEGMKKRKNYRVDIPAFNPYCTPSTIKITLRTGEAFDLLFHTREKIRQTARKEKGLYSKSLGLYGTIEIPNDLSTYSMAVQQFIKEELKLNEKFTDVKTKATDKKLTISKFRKFKWKLERKR